MREGEGNEARKAYHITHLIRDALEPGLYALCPRNHVCDLVSDDGL